MSLRPSRPGHDLALVTAFTALIAVCAILPGLKIGLPVPVTLQTFGVLLAGAVLGARRGFLAVTLYLVVGAAGLPVFSGGAAGLGVFQGPTMGYLLAFPFAAALCGFLVERLPRQKVASSVPLVFAAGFLSSALLIHTGGMAGLVWRLPTTWEGAWDIDKFFWAGDIVKNVVMALVATSVHRAFPDLLGTPRPVDRPERETIGA
ncbi:biotin transporter BioY [Nocardioides solisilvae]|uniref:biotin transporter BioY n=1 Tax=Nocardioides solisilvae TaxID=1542435 RepID=UPI000D74607F|nr:biotin transporter BioY [Nocardioides solisilvae]